MTQTKNDKPAPWWQWPVCIVASVLVFSLTLAVLCAVVAALRFPFFNPFHVTDDVLKTLIAGLATVVGASVVGGCAMFTTYSIITKIEKMKLDTQDNLEKRRIKFQGESELQRQHMELYKAIHAERMAASKELMEMAGSIWHKTFLGVSSGIQNDKRREAIDAIY